MRRRSHLVRLAPGLGWLTLALLAAALAWRFPATNGPVPGPAFFPLLMAVVLLVLALAQLLENVRDVRNADAATEREAEPKPPAPLSGAGQTACVLILVSAFAAAVPHLGFISTSALLVMGALRLFGYKENVRAGAFGLVVGFVLHVLFSCFMGVPLPQGWIG